MKTKTVSRVMSTLLIVAFMFCFSAAAFAEEHSASKAKALSYLQSKLDEQCPMQTFETEEPALSNAAYSYDSAIAALAFISEGDMERASRILDTFVVGIGDDPEFHDRIRNAYMSGNASTLPGYWNTQANSWYQDEYQVGTSTCTTAAVAVALLTYNSLQENSSYVDTAIKGIDWILANCSDSNPGYSAGYDGWPNANKVTVYTSKGTLDNLWLYAACNKLAETTGWEKYAEAAENAYSFVTEKMYSQGDTRFFEGTAPDGVSPNGNNVTVNAQCMAYLVLGEDAGLDNVKSNCKSKDGGFAYDNTTNNAEGFWVEGTAMTALSFSMQGETDVADRALSTIESVQLPSGGFPDASIPELSTGDMGLTYTDMPRIASSAWYILAVNGYNPFF